MPFIESEVDMKRKVSRPVWLAFLFGIAIAAAGQTYMPTVATKGSVNDGDIAVFDGIDGRYIRSGTFDFATTGTVAAIDVRVSEIELWPTGTWSEAYSWGDHSAAGYAGTGDVAAVSAALSNETVIGATITAGSEDSVVTNGRMLEITWNTNAVSFDVEYGITDETAYRGDWGNAVSGQADTALSTALGVGSGATGLVYAVGAALSNETVIGATITAGNTDSVVTNDRILEITWNTNAPNSGVSSINGLTDDVYVYPGTNMMSRINGQSLYLDMDIGNPYQPYSAKKVITSTDTLWIGRYDGSLIKIMVSNETATIAFDNANYSWDGVNRVGVELWAGTNSIAFDATITNEVEFDINEDGPTSLFFRRTGQEKWRGRQ